MMKYAIALQAFICLAISPASAEPCKGVTTPGVQACQAADLTHAEEELSRYVAAAKARIAKDDHPDQTVQRFDAAQTTWTQYRKSECDAVYEAWSSGTIRGSMALECMRRVTETRTHDVWRNWLVYVDRTPATLPEPDVQHER